MTKYTITLICLFLALLNLDAQESQNPFEGKTFEVSDYNETEFQKLGNLSFTNSYVESSESDQLGIEKTTYSITPIDDNLYSFYFTMKSPKYGRITWFGIKFGDKISGDLLCAKKGEAHIHSTFTGRLK